MFKIIKTKTLEKILFSQDKDKLYIEGLEDCLREERDKVAALEAELKQLREENANLSGELKELSDPIGEDNYVTLYVSDDLTRITPYIKLKESLFDKMVELGHVNDALPDNSIPFAMQIALMVIAAEGLDQIISSFESEVEHE